MNVDPVETLETPKCCLWCLAKPLEILALGFRLYTCECDHSGRDYHSEYKLSKFLVSRQLLVIFANAFLSYLNLAFLIESDFGDWSSITRLMCLLASTSGIITQIQMPFTTRTRVRAMKLLDYVLTEFNGIGTISFGSKEAEGLRLRFLLAAIILLGFGVFCVVVMMLDMQYNEGENFYLFCNIAVDGYIPLCAYLLSYCYVHTYKSIVTNGINLLKENLYSGLRSHRDNTEKLCENIGNFSKMYLVLTRFIELYVSTVTLSIVQVMFYLNTELIVQYVILFQWLLMKNVGLHGTILVLIHNVIAILITIVLLHIAIYCESMAEIGEELISFLERCPLRELPQEVIDQVELLVRVLKLRSPIPKPGDMITIRMGILVTIFSNVITYIISMIQFNAIKPPE